MPSARRKTLRCENKFFRSAFLAAAQLECAVAIITPLSSNAKSKCFQQSSNNCAMPQQTMRAILTVLVDNVHTCMESIPGSRAPASPVQKSRFDEFYGDCASHVCPGTEATAPRAHGRSSQRRSSITDGMTQQWETFYGGSGFRS